MTVDLVVVFILLLTVFGLLIWGRWRYDLVSFGALIVAVIVGVVPIDDAFSGFSHSATVIIALVLIVSRALTNSGVIELIGRHLVSASRSVGAHIGLMSTVAAGLSAVMNNVAALAVLMPVDLQAATKANRSPAATLMPLSFASILGGMITLIGTPPNIIVAEFRKDELGESFSMFDFAPVGLACAIVGVLFIATLGWRLIPRDRVLGGARPEPHEVSQYVAELKVPAGASVIDKRVAELDSVAEAGGATVVGLIRRGRRLPGAARREKIRAKDVLMIEANSDAIDQLAGEFGLEYVRRETTDSEVADHDLTLMEVVVPEGARIEGRSAQSLRLLQRHDVTLLGVSRQGRRFREQIRKLPVKAGDVLLLLGPNDRLPEIAGLLGCLPLAKKGLQVIQRDKALLAVGIFAGAYQIGYLVLFAPGGIGPRELIMSQMLMPFLPGIAPIIAILSRLWTIIIEITATGLSLTVRK